MLVALEVEELAAELDAVEEGLVLGLYFVGLCLESRGMPPLPFVVLYSWHYCEEDGVRLCVCGEESRDKLAAADICRRDVVRKGSRAKRAGLS